MIGAFLINGDADVCFAQYGAHERISGMRITAGKTCVIDLDNGSEEMLTTEINPEIAKSLSAKPDILVVHLTDEGTALEEYLVPLTILP